MASDRGKQQAYCKVCSKQFSVSHGGIDDVRSKKHLELFNGFLKKITDFPRVVPHFFFQKLNMSDTCQNATLLEITFHGSVNLLWDAMPYNSNYFIKQQGQFNKIIC